MTTPKAHFTPLVCVDAANLAIDYHVRNGNCRPIPWRMRALIQQLTIEAFCGRKITDATRLELVDRLSLALKPWIR